MFLQKLRFKLLQWRLKRQQVDLFWFCIDILLQMPLVRHTCRRAQFFLPVKEGKSYTVFAKKCFLYNKIYFNQASLTSSYLSTDSRKFSSIHSNTNRMFHEVFPQDHRHFQRPILGNLAYIRLSIERFWDEVFPQDFVRLGIFLEIQYLIGWNFVGRKWQIFWKVTKISSHQGISIRKEHQHCGSGLNRRGLCAL